MLSAEACLGPTSHTTRFFEYGGLGMELTWLVPVAGIAAVFFALWLARDVLSRDTGTAEMQEIGGMIFEGAMAFLSRQYRTIAVFAVLTSILIGGVVGLTSDGVKEIV